MAGKPVDGIGLAALALGSALMYAGVKGYSFLVVLENLVTGKPFMTDVKIAHTLTRNIPTEVPQSPQTPPQYGTDRAE